MVIDLKSQDIIIFSINIKEQITVNIPDPFANKDISKPVANEQSLEKGNVQINK